MPVKGVSTAHETGEGRRSRTPRPRGYGLVITRTFPVRAPFQSPANAKSVATLALVLRLSILVHRVPVMRVLPEPIVMARAMDLPFNRSSLSRLKFSARSQASTCAAKARQLDQHESCGLKSCFLLRLRQRGGPDDPRGRGSHRRKQSLRSRQRLQVLRLLRHVLPATSTAAAPSFILRIFPAVCCQF